VNRSHALVRTYNFLRERAGRRSVEPDPQLPASWIIGTLFELLPELVRGVFRTRHMILLADSVTIRGRGRIDWGRGCRIGRGSSIDGYARRGVRLGPGSRLGDYCRVTCTSHVSRMGEGLNLGAGSGFGDHCHFGASGGITIGNDVIGGPYVSFHSQDHVYDDRARLIRDQGTTELGISVGNDCWIGARVTFLDGSSIGDHCVVAAGTVVRGTYPSHSVIAGVPSRLVKDSFPTDKD
jgi:acetyltransferase-like isoleucine patch superfamily enzyme